MYMYGVLLVSGMSYLHTHTYCMYLYVILSIHNNMTNIPYCRCKQYRTDFYTNRYKDTLVLSAQRSTTIVRINVKIKCFLLKNCYE